MQIAVLAAFILAMTLVRYAPWPGPLSAWTLAPAVALYVAVAGALAAANAAWFRRALAKHEFIPGGPLRRHRALLLVAQGWLVGGLAGLIMAGWGQWVMTSLALADVPLAGTLLMLSPFFAATVLVWLMDYPCHRDLRLRLARIGAMLEVAEPAAGAESVAQAPASPAADAISIPGPWTLRQYLDYHIRHELLFIVVPLSLIVAAGDAVAIYLGPLLPQQYAQTIVAVLTGGASLAIFLVAPAVIVRVWRTRPLHDGPLRASIEALCGRMKIRFREVLVWQTGSVIANAAVMGLVGPVRYLLLGDALLERASERDIEAVFAHEAQHVRGHHIFYAMLFAICAAATCTLAAGGLCALSGITDERIEEFASIALLAVAWGGGFGWLSRRLERQCDVHSAWLMGQLPQAAPGQSPDDMRITPEGAAAFAHALQRIAIINGISTTQGNWRHGSIASRVEHVLWLGVTGGSRETIDRTVRRVKIALWIVAAALALAMIFQY